MYVVANVETFLADLLLEGRWIVRQEIAQQAVLRAKALADKHGCLGSRSAEFIFDGDVGLIAAFFGAMQHDPVRHAGLALPALRASLRR